MEYGSLPYGISYPLTDVFASTLVPAIPGSLRGRAPQRGSRGLALSGVGFFSLCLVASFPLDLRESWPNKRNKPSCWQASPLQQSHGNEHHPPRKTTHLARLLAAFVAGASDMGLR